MNLMIDRKFGVDATIYLPAEVWGTYPSTPDRPSGSGISSWASLLRPRGRSGVDAGAELLPQRPPVVRRRRRLGRFFGHRF